MGVAIADARGAAPFRAFRERSRSPKSGLVKDGFPNSPNQFNATSSWFEFLALTVPLDGVFLGLDVRKRIDFFSVDIEGAELMAMATFPFDEYRFSVLSVDNPPAELRRLLLSRGYEYLCGHGNFGDQMWFDARELGKGPESAISLDCAMVSEGPTRPVLDDTHGAMDPHGKRCDMHLSAGFFGTEPKEGTITAAERAQAVPRSSQSSSPLSGKRIQALSGGSEDLIPTATDESRGYPTTRKAAKSLLGHTNKSKKRGIRRERTKHRQSQRREERRERRKESLGEAAR